MSSRVTFIVNPRSSGGMSRKRLEEVELAIKAAFPNARLRRTTHPRAAVELAAEARREEVDLLGVVGGDGTVNEAVNGLLEAPLSPGDKMPALGVVPTGTGCDFVKSIGVPRDLHGALDVIKRGVTRRCDAVRIRSRRRDDGSEIVYYFVNMGGFGANGQVVYEVNRSSKRLGGFLTFASATVNSVFTYKGARVRYRVDEGPWRSAHLMTLFIANGQYQGGGMRTGNGARLDDGRFKVIAIDHMGPMKLMGHLGRLYSGDMDGLDWAFTAEGATVDAEAEGGDQVLIDSDGEGVGMLPARFEIVPGVLPVFVGADAVGVDG